MIAEKDYVVSVTAGDDYNDYKTVKNVHDFVVITGNGGNVSSPWNMMKILPQSRKMMTSFYDWEGQWLWLHDRGIYFTFCRYCGRRWCFRDCRDDDYFFKTTEDVQDFATIVKNNDGFCDGTIWWKSERVLYFAAITAFAFFNDSYYCGFRVFIILSVRDSDNWLFGLLEFG